jgi:uncharacterized membrane protein
MSEIPPGGTPSPPPAMQEPVRAETGLRSLAMLCYVLFLIACVNGFTAFIGVIIAYVKRGDARGTIWESHFDNVITVFWVMLIAGVAGLLSLPFSLGLLIASFPWGFFTPGFSAFSLPVLLWLVVLPLLVLWYFYRLIRGLLRAGEDRAC